MLVGLVYANCIIGSFFQNTGAEDTTLLTPCAVEPFQSEPAIGLVEDVGVVVAFVLERNDLERIVVESCVCLVLDELPVVGLVGKHLVVQIAEDDDIAEIMGEGCLEVALPLYGNCQVSSVGELWSCKDAGKDGQQEDDSF